MRRLHSPFLLLTERTALACANMVSRMQRRGFTLIEVLVGIVILGFILTTSLAIFFERQRRLRQADETIAAYQALANEAELQRHMPFNALLPNAPHAFESNLAILEAIHEPQPVVNVELTKGGRKLVHMTIVWANGKRSASLTIVRTDLPGGSLW
jgi:prepilin-type N-terminal cleavage/methylation domain-containing protein